MNNKSILPLILWGMAIACFVALIVNLSQDASSAPSEIPYSTFAQAANDGKVVSVEVKGDELTGILNNSFAKEASTNPAFITQGPVTDSIQERLINSGAKISYISPEESSFDRWLPFIAFTAVIALIFFFFFRQMAQINRKAMSVGSSTHKVVPESKRTVTFDDVAGVEEAKQDLQEIVEFLRDPEKFTRLGGRIPRGVLLLGPPGTGKTLLARSVAGEANVPFFSISGSHFVELYIGVGASRVRDLFEQAKASSPCIIFIDEIDAIGRRRNSINGSEEREQTLNQLLVEMDGFDSNDNVILIGATNRAESLDPALTRPGRFDRRVTVPVPDMMGREKILGIHTRKTPLASDIDLKTIARGTPGFSGAELENLVNEAALQAARYNKKVVSNDDFEFARDKILMGAERRSAFMTEESKRVTAFHEAGHALVAILQPGTDPIHKVSIMPRGGALGVTQQLPEEDRYALSKDYAVKRLAVMMGGRAAEKIVFDQRTTGAGNDIEVATDLARQMVCAWGMSDVIGAVAYSSHRSSPFSYQQQSSTHPFSEQIAQTIDMEVAAFINQANETAERLLTENRLLLDVVAQALIEFETIDRKELELLVETESLDALRKGRASKEEASEDEEVGVRRPKRETVKFRPGTIMEPSSLEPSSN